MLIVCISMVKNEADIIEAFCRHNARFFDLMLIIDNGSTDRTAEIVLDLAREGLPLVLAEDPEVAYRQAERMTNAFRSVCHAVMPDFVLLLDADEFLRCEDRDALARHLAAIPERGCGLLPWTTYVCPPDEPESVVPLSYMTRRLRREVEQFYKVAIRVPGDDFEGISIQQGNHRIRHSAREVESLKMPELAIGHFPLRSPQQLAAKVVIGRMAYVARSPTPGQYGRQWHRLYEELLVRGQFTWAETSAAAMSYLGEGGSSYEEDTLDDPIAAPPALRHAARPGHALATVARSWEAQLRGAPETATAIRVARQLAEAGTALAGQADLPPFSFVFEKHRLNSVVQVGSGSGIYLRLAQACGAERVCAVDEQAPAAGCLSSEEQRVERLDQHFDLGTTFDAVICLDAAERVPRDREDVLLATLAAHADRLILFSAEGGGAPGPRDAGSCSPCSLTRWLGKWAALGWHPLLCDTLAFRALATSAGLKRHAVLLGPSPAEDHAAAVLERAAAAGWRGWSDPAGVVDVPFRQLPPSGAGARW